MLYKNNTSIRFNFLNLSFSFEKVELKAVGGGNTREKSLKQKVIEEMYKKQNPRSGIAASFSPGLLKDNNKDHSAKETLAEAFRKVLKNLNFKLGQSTTRQISPPWKVSVNPNASYNVQVNLDEEMNVLKVAERPLHWVHGTIIDGRREQFNGNIRINPDVRLLVSTQDIVEKKSELYGFAVPVPLELNSDKLILHNKTIKNGGKDYVSLIRHVKMSEVYTNGKVDACIVSGDVYICDEKMKDKSSYELKVNKPFCELSLMFDSTPVVEAVNNNFTGDGLREFVKHFFELSLSVKEELDQILKSIDSGDKWYNRMSP